MSERVEGVLQLAVAVETFDCDQASCGRSNVVHQTCAQSKYHLASLQLPSCHSVPAPSPPAKLCEVRGR